MSEIVKPQIVERVLVESVSDPCEWFPAENRPAWSNDPAHGYAILMIGAGTKWRLCRECAALPEFKRFRVRREIDRRTK